MQTHKSFITIALILLISALLFTTSLADTSGNISRTGARVNITAEDADKVSAAGAWVIVNGNIKQDMWLAGAAVEVDAQVSGDLYAAGAKINVTGKVYGSAHLAGAEIMIDAIVDKKLEAVGALITFSETSAVGDNSSAVAAAIEFDGTAKGYIELYADDVIFNGQGDESVFIQGRNVHIADNVAINGDLYINSVETPIISDYASISGSVKHKIFTEEEYARVQDVEDTLFSDFGGKVIIGISAFLLGLLLIVFNRNTTDQMTGLLRAHPGHSILWGLAIFFGLPLIVFFCLVSVVGIPIGITSLLVIPFLILLGFTAAILSLSDYLLIKSGQPKETKQRLGFLLLSILIYYAVRLIPVLGAIVVFVAMLFGLGASVVTIGRKLKANNEVEPFESS